jgi:hypothetical protein
MKLAAIACALLLAVACASSEEATPTTQESPPQDGPYQADGTPEIETEQEAKEVALWFLRGRGFLSDTEQVETTVIESEDWWFVGVDESGDEHAVGSGLFIDMARSGLWMRMSSGR